MSDSDVPDVRSARRAQREAERAARAQRKADAARERALEAARAGGLFEGMEAMPRTGSAEVAAESDGGSGAATGDGSAPPAPPVSSREPLDPTRQRRLTTALAAVSVVLLVVTGLSTWQYVEARGEAATEQQIADAPRAATDAAREIATQMFTYDHRTVDAELAAVRERLTDPALTEFVEQSMPAVASAAKQQEASVYATVAAAAPQEVVDADSVTVLVMLNRMVSTREDPEAASSASRLSLSMERVDGTWKLGELEAL
ncbi:hypothetical protein CEY15_13365 [Dietzia natronolimnaea]|uniref:Mce-associated membrane protein n=1 Tax=Dietzia natronolimnaea TaxID=161920 RepID=A0A2A2WMU2_9ACTN|nr:hypothetical protein [Dietzia natronolimnaea]PAY22517.1 hypothetical protein CEY15_13365 [Dietzia natronolimnaea]